MSNSYDRSQLRKQLQAKRRGLTAAEWQSAGHAVSKRLLDLPQVQQANCLGAYLALPHELPLTALIDSLTSRQVKLVVPVIDPAHAGIMHFQHYHRSDNLSSNAFGIAEPAFNAEAAISLQQVDVLLVPLLGFDAQGNRLGMGGGYYDRALAAWRAGELPHLLPIGIAHSIQQVEAIPHAKWDVPLPMIVTPEQNFSTL